MHLNSIVYNNLRSFWIFQSLQTIHSFENHSIFKNYSIISKFSFNLSGVSAILCSPPWEIFRCNVEKALYLVVFKSKMASSSNNAQIRFAQLLEEANQLLRQESSSSIPFRNIVQCLNVFCKEEPKSISITLHFQLF